MTDDLLDFGPFQLDRRRKLLLKDGTPLALGHRAFVLAEALAAARGGTVTKADLLDAAWPGLHVEENNLAVQIGALRKAMGETADGGDWIVTVPRIGYRLALPSSGAAAGERSAALQPARGDGRPSIAVLPFLNLSSDPEQDYFSDGVVEEIIIALSQMRWLFVIARNSSFTYKGRTVDVKQVGEELGVRYVLEGSVRKAGSRLRIAAQLIDAEVGANLWAGRFEGVLDDVFDLQDRVTASVVGAIAPKLEAAEIERLRRKPTASSGAYDHFLRGMMGFHAWSREGSSVALAQFGKAAEIDPAYGAAFGMAARTYVQRNSGGWMDDRAREFAEAERMAQIAASIGRDDAVCLSTAGFALSDLLGRVEDGDALVERALGLNPNLAWAWLYASWIKTALGEPELALDRVRRAMELSPNDPHGFSFLAAQSNALLFAGRFAEAFTAAAGALRERPDFLLYNCLGAAAAALSGNAAEASRIAARVEALKPGITAAEAATIVPVRRDRHRRLFEDGLARAGLRTARPGLS